MIDVTNEEKILEKIDHYLDLNKHVLQFSQQIWLSIIDAQTIIDLVSALEYNFAIYEWDDNQMLLGQSYEYTKSNLEQSLEK